MENLWDNQFFPLKHGKIRNPWNEWENLEEPMEPLIFERKMTILFELGDGTIYSRFKVHGSDLLFQRWLRHLFNSDFFLRICTRNSKSAQKMAQPYMCKMGQIAPSTPFLI